MLQPSSPQPSKLNDTRSLQACSLGPFRSFGQPLTTRLLRAVQDSNTLKDSLGRASQHLMYRSLREGQLAKEDRLVRLAQLSILISLSCAQAARLGKVFRWMQRHSFRWVSPAHVSKDLKAVSGTAESFKVSWLRVVQLLRLEILVSWLQVSSIISVSFVQAERSGIVWSWSHSNNRNDCSPIQDPNTSKAPLDKAGHSLMCRCVKAWHEERPDMLIREEPPTKEIPRQQLSSMWVKGALSKEERPLG